MYSTLPSFVLGFHGCDQSVVDSVVRGESVLQISRNTYDWLGDGVYFWENDPERALEYAETIRDNPKRGQGEIHNPAVIGAIINLGHCLNLMESGSLESVRLAYHALKAFRENAGIEMPVNTPGKDGGNDLLLRHLDCAVIQFLHDIYDRREHSIDTVRGLFIEGEDLYPNAGFKAKNHIQVCVRNPNCIKGYFLPRVPDTLHTIP